MKKSKATKAKNREYIFRELAKLIVSPAGKRCALGAQQSGMRRSATGYR